MNKPATTQPYRLALLLTAALSLNACTSMINAVTSEPIQPDPGETSIGTDIDDWQMSTMIGVNIKKASPQLASSHINVSTYNKVVLLTGEVASNELRILAGTTARNYKDVRQVYNELKLQGSSSLLARTNDSWLTTKVKSKLLANKEVVSGEIEVITESGIVYLMGIVSRDTADRATAVASNTGGVVKVVRVFEYLN